MPELPEVEAMRHLAEDHCVGRTVVRVVTREVGGGPRDGQFDDKVMAEGVSETAVATNLMNRQIVAARRHGKHMWLELSGEGPCCMLHFGMTGSLAVEGVDRFAWQSFSVDDVWPPRFTKLQLDLQHHASKNANVVRLAFVDPRRFARVLFRNKPMAELPLSLLAPDPLVVPPSLEDFSFALRRSSMAVKSSLLDQERLVCGVGNWVADEVLRLAGVHPASPGRTLSDRQIASVHRAVMLICQKAVEVKADASCFPINWLFHCRWGQGSGGSSVTMLDGTCVAFMDVGGRTTAYVPAEQQEGELFNEDAKATPFRRKRKSTTPQLEQETSQKNSRKAKTARVREPSLAAAQKPSTSTTDATAAKKRPAAGTSAKSAFKVPLRQHTSAAAPIDL